MSVLIKDMEMPKSCGDCKAFVCYSEWPGDAGDCFCGITKQDTKADALNADCPLVPAPPEQKEGHWIDRFDPRFTMSNHLIICSECGIAFISDHQIRRAYCPNCGAAMMAKEIRALKKMRGEEDE